MFLEISQNSRENTSARVSFSIKFLASGGACYFIKKETLAQIFSSEFCEISENTFFTEHIRTTASTLSLIKKLLALTKRYYPFTTDSWQKNLMEGVNLLQSTHITYFRSCIYCGGFHVKSDILATYTLRDNQNAEMQVKIYLLEKVLRRRLCPESQSK